MKQKTVSSLDIMYSEKKRVSDVNMTSMMPLDERNWHIRIVWDFLHLQHDALHNHCVVPSI